MGSCLKKPPKTTQNNEEGATATKQKQLRSETEMTSVTMQPITSDHINFKLAQSIQSGLYNSLSSNGSFLNDLTAEENREDRSKSIIDQSAEKTDYKMSNGNTNEIFTEYAPEIFDKLRKKFKIANNSFLDILTGDNNALRSFLSNSKSGQYFFFSHNSQFIIKTMNKSELSFLLTLIPSYYEHICSYEHSLMPKFYGVYKLNSNTTKDKDLAFLISNNVFYSTNKQICIKHKYDLKGSTQGRKTENIQKEKGEILKDLNFIEDDVHLHISENGKDEIFYKQIENDTQWFAKHHIMDYSLLIGIADNVNESVGISQKNVINNGEIVSNDGKRIYFLGIIDILQKYNSKKKVAAFVKGIKHEKSTLSTVPPDLYARRFCKFFENRVL